MRIFSFVILILLSASLLLAQNGRQQVAEGNRLFAEEKYDEANNKYRDAQLKNPESPRINFNIGNVHYKKKKLKEAIQEYEVGLRADDVMTRSKAYYNIGNAYYRQGKLPESIMAYKQALELNPEDEDAKYNLEFVRAKLKDEANKQDQNQQQQQQQQDQQEQSQGENEQSQEQDPQEQPQPDSQQQQEQQKDEQEEQQEQQQEQQEQPQPQPREQREISKEDAERILDALSEEEQEELEKQQQAKARGRAFRGKDW